MHKLFPKLMIPALLMLALAGCFGGGGTNDNPAAGVEPGEQLQQDNSDLLVNDNFALPTDDLDNDSGELDLTGTPDMDAAIFGNDSTDDALFSGSGDSGALDAETGDSTIDLFATPDVTSGP